ncbi:ATP-binding protein [Kordiimonas sp.]|uniref:sensor histidine kinase n=1 Tax=Kordiimonas sp. TaxID=1970157 RepID=UPI003A9247AF
MPRIWLMLLLVFGLGVLTVISPFTFFISGQNNVQRLDHGWVAFDGELVAPASVVARLDNGREVASLPDFMRGQAGGDGAFGATTYVRAVSGWDENGAMIAGKIRSVYRYYAVYPDGTDGYGVELLGGNGDPALPDPEAHAMAPPGLMRVHTPVERFWLVIHVANTSHFQGGLLTAPGVQDLSQATDAQSSRLASVMLYAGLFIAMGLYTVLLALWHAGESYYYSGGFVLVVIAIRLILLQDYEWLFLPDLSYAISLRLEYLTFFVIVTMFYALAYGLFPREASKRSVGALAGVSGLFALVALFAPLDWMIASRNAYIVVGGIAGIMVLMVFLRARSRGRPGAGIAVAGWSIIVAAMVADAVVTAAGVLEGLESVPVAAVSFALILMWLFTMRYREEQKERLALSAHLEAANAELEARATQLDIAQARAEEALQIKSSFLANISHEVRTPLNAIIGFSDLLISQSHSPLDGQKVRDYLQLIRRNGQELLILMSDILSVSDLDAGRFEVAHETFSPEDVVSMSVNLLAPAAHEKQLFLDVQADSAVMEGDIRILRQAVIKVLANAVKYAPENGVVTVRGTADENVYFVRITDTGAGMSKAHVEAIMSVFGRRGDAYTADDHSVGMSVGLPLVSKLLLRVGGRLQVESIPSVGTTVTIVYPRQAAQSTTGTASGASE